MVRNNVSGKLFVRREMMSKKMYYKSFRSENSHRKFDLNRIHSKIERKIIVEKLFSKKILLWEF